MLSNEINNINSYSFSDSENIKKEKHEQEFNISYILIKIDDNLSKKKYAKIVKEIAKIEKENKEILSQKENVKYFVYLFEIKILCLCYVIEGKISDFYIYRKNSLVFNSNLENMKLLEKTFNKLKKILEEDMTKLRKYINDKSIITDNMKEHIILSYSRGIYLQGKFCKLKKQIIDASAFFNIGINLLKKNLNKSIESETFCLYAKFLLSLSCILIEDNSIIMASEKIYDAIKFFIKALFLKIDNPNGISIDDFNKKAKNNSFIDPIRGLIISLFLLGICLEKIDLLDNAVTLYNQSYWLFKKFYRNIDTIFYSIIRNLAETINEFKEDEMRIIKNRHREEKKLEKLRIIHEKNIIKAMKLTNISNRGSFNEERYLKIEKRLKNVLNNIEKKYGNKNEDDKIFLPIIKYMDFDKNKFDFTLNYLVKEKEMQMEKKISLKNNKNKTINTENNLIGNENKIKLFKGVNQNFSNNNIFNTKKINKKINFNSIDNNHIKNNKRKKTFSYKEKLQKKLFIINNIKLLNDELKSEENEYLNTKPDSNTISNFNLKSKSNSINTNINSVYNLQTFQNFQNKNNFFKTIKLRGENKNYKKYKNNTNYKNFNSENNIKLSNNFFNTDEKSEKNTKIKTYLKNSGKKQKNTQKGFLTKNSFIFCKSFRKGMQYLEKMDKKETNFQKQLMHLKNYEAGFDEGININTLKTELSKDKIKEDAENIYLKIRDKIEDKIKIDNNIEFTNINEKTKEIEKMMIQKKNLENSLIMGLNESKIDKIRKLEQNLDEMKKKQFIKILNNDNYKNQRKKNIYDENKLITEIENANRKNNEMVDSLDNEIIKCEQRNMLFKKRKKEFYFPINLKKFKIKG